MSAPRGAKPNPLAERDVVPPGEVLELRAPADLSDAARPVWDEVVPWLAAKGALVQVDVVLLVELVESIGLARRYRVALTELVTSGRLPGMDEDGAVVVQTLSGPLADALILGSPIAKRLRSGYVEALSRATSLASCFGLTPTDRVRLGLGTGRDQGQSLGEAIAAAIKATAAAVNDRQQVVDVA